jgi:hypothetical protein
VSQRLQVGRVERGDDDSGGQDEEGRQAEEGIERPFREEIGTDLLPREGRSHGPRRPSPDLLRWRRCLLRRRGALRASVLRGECRRCLCRRWGCGWYRHRWRSACDRCGGGCIGCYQPQLSLQGADLALHGGDRVRHSLAGQQALGAPRI